MKGRASQTEDVPAMEQPLTWLPANIPPGDETTSIHGDYRIDNLIFHPDRAAYHGGGGLGAVHSRGSARGLFPTT